MFPQLTFNLSFTFVILLPAVIWFITLLPDCSQQSSTVFFVAPVFISNDGGCFETCHIFMMIINQMLSLKLLYTYL